MHINPSLSSAYVSQLDKQFLGQFVNNKQTRNKSGNKKFVLDTVKIISSHNCPQCNFERIVLPGYHLLWNNQFTQEITGIDAITVRTYISFNSTGI